MAKASGSMIRATAKASLTGIRGLRRSLTRPPRGKPLKLVILFAAAVIRAVRIYHEAGAIVEALTAGAPAGIAEALTAGAVAGNPPRSGAEVIAPSVEVSGAVKRGNRAAGVVQAARVPEAAVAEAVAAVAVAEAGAVAVEVEGDDKD